MAKRTHAHKIRNHPKSNKKKKEKGAIPNARAYAEKPASEEQIQHFRNVIETFLKKANGRPVSRADLVSKCRGKGKPGFLRALRLMTEEGLIAERRSGFVWAAAAGMMRGKITRVLRSFGYAKPENGAAECFIPGRDLRGALPGDTVLLMPVAGSGASPEAVVVTVIEQASPQLSGMLLEEDGALRFLPDRLTNRPLQIVNAADWTGHTGEKVIAEVAVRGDRHSKHTVRILASLGSAETARACAEALVTVSGVPTEFPQAVLDEAAQLEQRGITEADLAGRLDLRQPEDVIFTIDGFDAKDLDDAVSIAKTDSGFRLGVHIADVSHYVQQDSPLDKEAMSRGTSIYYADQVIPMLPKALSNGICSLHPDVDRLSFSALMELDKQGEIVHAKFVKSVIRSAVKGVYREVNAILDGTADAETEAKYAAVKESLLLLNELRELRLAARAGRGAPSLEAEESAFLLDENGVCQEVIPRTRGKGEELIEECMLLANEAAARLGRTQHLPFVYRVHADPPEEKALRLSEMLNRLSIPHPALDQPKPKDYAQILKNAEGSPLKAGIHQMVLRSMSKADYETEPVGHFGLALKDYAHFTSPIRRYPDLAIHRILSAYLTGTLPERTGKFAREAAVAGTAAEQRAVQLERECDDRYRAEWASQHIGETFSGVISGTAEFGVYVMLPNTAEGLISLEALPPDDYSWDGLFSLTGTRTGRVFSLGQELEVTITRADINSGQIDFSSECGVRSAECGVNA